MINPDFSFAQFLAWPHGIGASDLLHSPWLIGGDLVAVGVCAITGVLKARRMQMDLVGASVIAVVSGLGGGTLRDLLLGHGPVFWLLDPRGVAVALLCGWATFVIALRRRVEKRTFQIPDAIGLALFTVLGAEKALLLGHGWLVAIMLGVMTGTFGGVLRDVLCNEIPSLFVRREFYATAATAGALAFILARATTLAGWMAAALSAALIVGLRLGSLRWRWHVPGFDKESE